MGFTHLLVLSMNSLKTSSKAGFTLIEIVAVVTIITVVIAVTAPQIGGVFTAVRLRTDADAVYSKLLEAQSLAVLFNTDAELRLYEVPDLVGERATLRKLRILTLRPPEDDAAADANEFEPLGTVTTLDNEIEISQDDKHSSIVKVGFEDSSDDKFGRYIPIRFRSDGSLALEPTDRWFLTLHEKDAHLRDPKLKNFVTIQIEPTTGRLRTFQP